MDIGGLSCKSSSSSLGWGLYIELFSLPSIGSSVALTVPPGLESLGRRTINGHWLSSSSDCLLIHFPFLASVIQSDTSGWGYSFRVPTPPLSQNLNEWGCWTTLKGASSALIHWPPLFGDALRLTAKFHWLSWDLLTHCKSLTTSAHSCCPETCRLAPSVS